MPRTELVMLAIVVSVLTSRLMVYGQSSLMLTQDRDGVSPRLLTPSEKAALGDPLFNLVLRDHADETSLTAIQNLIQPDATKRQIFAVEEHIGSDEFGDRRAVVAFTGEHRGEDLTGNVMFSVIFGPQSFPPVTTVEGWGWDNHRGRYNYYKLDTVGGGLTWKFRGASDDADLLTFQERRGTCMACHLNGAPVMKELLFPWNNWHSNVGGGFSARYLTGQFAANPWPISNDPSFKNHLNGAEDLERMIIQAISRFNTGRINAGLKRRDDNGNIAEQDGRQTMMEGSRLLKPLFHATEFNLVSARQRSGRDPWGDAPGPAQDIVIPNSFFLNVGLIAGGGFGGYNGLGIDKAKQFNSVGLILKEEYSGLIEEFEVRMNQVKGRDTLFAWFVPEHSHIDIDLIDRLLRRGVITPHFLAAALAVDLEEPLYLSNERASLHRFIPDEFDFVPVPSGTDPNSIPRDPAKDQLTKLVLEAIEAVPEAERSDADKRFLERLKAADARTLLANDVDAYLTRVRDKLESADANVRRTEVSRLFQKSLDLRRAVLRDRTFGTLDETRGTLLFPLPN
jgi:hypothetical protein